MLGQTDGRTPDAANVIKFAQLGQNFCTALNYQ